MMRKLQRIVLVIVLLGCLSWAGIPQDIRVSNVRNVSVGGTYTATISWESYTNETGKIFFGANSQAIVQEVTDVRGSSFSDSVHYVVINGLAPNTRYYYSVQSGSVIDDNGGRFFQFTTGAPYSPGLLGVTPSVLSPVVLSNGTAGNGTIVFYQVSGNSSVSNLNSSLVNSGSESFFPNQYWFYFSNFRTNDLLNDYSYSAADFVSMHLTAGAKGIYLDQTFTIPSLPYLNATITLNPFVIDSTPPNPVTSVTTATANTSITLNWAPSNSPDNSGTIVTYRSDRPPANSYDGTYLIFHSTTANSLVLSGLSTGTTYYFSITAFDQQTNLSSIYNVSVVLPLIPRPASITGLIVTTGNAWTSATYSSSLTAGTITYITRKTGNMPSNYLDGLVVTNNLSPIGTFSDAGLDAGVTYNYMFTAVDIANSLNFSVAVTTSVRLPYVASSIPSNSLFLHDFDNQSTLSKSGGYWFVFSQNGSLSDGVANSYGGFDPRIVAGGGFSTSYSARVAYTTSATTINNLVALGVNMRNPQAVQDLSNCDYLDFYLKGSGHQLDITLQPYTNLTSFDDYTVTLNTTTTWNRYRIQLTTANFKQQGWGTTVPLRTILQNLGQLQFRVQNRLTVETGYFQVDEVYIAQGVTPSNVTNVSLTTGNGMITVNWTPSTSPNYAGVYITYRTDRFPVHSSDGTAYQVTSSTANRYLVSNLAYNTTYNFLVSAYSTDSKTATGVQLQTYLPVGSAIVPAPITALSVITGNYMVFLAWTPSVSPNTSTVIVRRADRYPTSIVDGTQIYSGTSNVFSDGPLANGSVYYYYLVAKDLSSNYSVSVTISAYLPSISMGSYLFVTDFENGTNLSNVGGYWFTYADSAGTLVTPIASAIVNGGANGTNKSAALSYTLSATQNNFAGLGVAMTKTDVTIDASASLGIEFWMKGTGKPVFIELLGSPNATNFDNHSIQINTVSGWKKYIVPFTSFLQKGWGPVVPLATILQNLWHINFAAKSDIAGTTGSFAVDEVRIHPIGVDLIPPLPVTNATVQTQNAAAILRWTNSVSTKSIGLRIQRSITGYPAGPTSDVNVLNSMITTTSFYDSSLINSTTYYYAIFTFDANANYSDAVYLSTTPTSSFVGPISVFNLKANDSEILLTWTQSDPSHAVGAAIYRNTTSNADGVLVTKNTGITYTDKGLLNGITYYYTIYAYDQYNTSSMKTTGHATPKLGGGGVDSGPIVINPYVEINSRTVIDGDYINNASMFKVFVSVDSPDVSVATISLQVNGGSIQIVTFNPSVAVSTVNIAITLNQGVNTLILGGSKGVNSAVTRNFILNVSNTNDKTKLQDGTKVLNYPNPFRPSQGSVMMTWSLNKDAGISVFLYNIRGELVWKNSYLLGSIGGQSGYNQVSWSGINAFNAKASNGIYIYRIVDEASNSVIGTGKMLVID